MAKENIKREKELVRNCIKGSREAWVEFVETYKGLVYSTILRSFQLASYRNAEEIADDIFQDFFHLLLRDDCSKLKSFKWKNGCSLASWLSVVARNLTLDHLRKYLPRRDKTAPLSAAQTSEVPSIDDMEQAERIEMYEEALARLTSKETLLMDLIYRQEVPYPVAAVILGKSVDALYMQKKRLVDKLKRYVDNMKS